MTEDLDRLLEKTKTKIFLQSSAAFLGSLLCSLRFEWSSLIPTAATNAIWIRFNPKFFLKLLPATRITVLLHEIWHVGKLHKLRMGSRDPQIWNYACDVRLNNDLENEGHSFVGVENCWKDHSYDANGILSEEEIYDKMIAAGRTPTCGSWGDAEGAPDIDSSSSSPADQIANIAAVVRAVQAAQMAGQAGKLPGAIQKELEVFLNPVVPWQVELFRFFTDLLEEDYTWTRPNRRYDEEYLPSRLMDDGRLEHLAYFLDVSGSITDRDILRFNSEVKYVQEVLKPQRLTLIQFDTEIQDIKEFTENDPFDKIKIVGRGGTSLSPVREWIEINLPTAAVVFTDLECAPMESLTRDIPVIWVVPCRTKPEVPFGKVIQIND